MDNHNDSAELEALFDSLTSLQGDIPAAAPPPPIAPPAPTIPPVAVRASVSSGTIDDSDDLQDLFDSIAASVSLPEPAPVFTAVAATATKSGVASQDQSIDEDGDWAGQEGVYKRIGMMARELHNSLKEMGYDKMLESTMSAIPDARDRLAYVANLTEQAACRVLNATDVAQPLVDKIQADSASLGARWDAAFANQLDVAAFKSLAEETRSYLKVGLPNLASATNAQLTEIMMAQDFQDLTGQVIKKIVILAESLESSLMKVLVEVMPDHCRQSEQVNSLLNGPVVTTEGRTDVVVSQEQVDDLLETLGF